MLIPQEKRLVVIGAGVSGLTTALLLSKKRQYQITVAAKHMPGDYDIEYASPWAGADFLPVSERGSEAAEWDRKTWYYLKDLAENHSDAGIQLRSTKVYNRIKDVDSPAPKFPLNPWWKDLFPDFKEIPKSELHNDFHNAFTFTSVCINTAIYLPWLVSQCLKAGVIFKRAVFNHIVEASQAHHTGLKANLIVNCTGISARKFGGVMDQTMTPVRGQIVVVRNDAGGNFSVSSTNDGPEETAYLMSRAAGGGTVLGGCSQKRNWESQPDPNLAIRIMKRCTTLCPRLVGANGGIEHLDIVRHGVGNRPFREEGTRIEKEVVEGNVVVHNYGHGSFGYQASFGCAEIAVNLIEASS